jgi:hypothetical protein
VAAWMAVGRCGRRLPAAPPPGPTAGPDRRRGRNGRSTGLRPARPAPRARSPAAWTRAPSTVRGARPAASACRPPRTGGPARRPRRSPGTSPPAPPTRPAPPGSRRRARPRPGVRQVPRPDARRGRGRRADVHRLDRADDPSGPGAGRICAGGAAGTRRRGRPARRARGGADRAAGRRRPRLTARLRRGAPLSIAMLGRRARARAGRAGGRARGAPPRGRRLRWGSGTRAAGTAATMRPTVEAFRASGPLPLLGSWNAIARPPAAPEGSSPRWGPTVRAS